MAPPATTPSSLPRRRRSTPRSAGTPARSTGHGSLAPYEALEVGIRLASALRYHTDRVSGLRAIAHEISRAVDVPVAVWAVAPEGSRLILLGDHRLDRGRHEELVSAFEVWKLHRESGRGFRTFGEAVRRIFEVPAVSVVHVVCGVLVLGRSSPEFEAVRRELASLLLGLSDTGAPTIDGHDAALSAGDPDEGALEAARLSSLTPREREVLVLVESGEGSRAIAQRLAISQKTVKTHVQNIFAKLDVHSRLEAGALARRNGFAAGPTPQQGLLPLE
jgi:DNA-binding CsgD family transcriptional regulator